MTYWFLAVLALLLSFGALRWRNALLSLGSIVGWLILWRYNTTYPPTNIVVGDVTHEWLTYLYIILALAMLFIWMANRKRGYTGYSRTAEEERDYQSIVKSPSGRSTPLMSQSESEYRATVRRSLRSRRKRR